MRLLRTAAAALLAVPFVCLAESHNPGDYPLRVHIFSRSQTSFYHQRMLDDAQGEGRADLYEGSDVHGVDFNYNCDRKLRSSFGFETYPARWRKPGRKLVVLLPVFGKAGSYWTCELNTDMKNFAYYRGRNGIGAVPEQKYLDWMARHNYDPIHGKDHPTRPADAAKPASAQP